MSDYREVARAARAKVISEGLPPGKAWDEAAKRIFNNSPSKAKNGYPRTTFLGLCEAGYVKGIPAGEYADRAGVGKEHGVRMVELLREDDDYEDDPEILFTDATDGKVLKDHGQLDVVFGLWNHGLVDGQ